MPKNPLSKTAEQRLNWQKNALAQNKEMAALLKKKRFSDKSIVDRKICQTFKLSFTGKGILKEKNNLVNKVWFG